MTFQNAAILSPNPTSVSTPENGQQSLGPGPTGVVRRGQSRASNDALAWLAVQDVTPTGYRVGKFLAHHARYATGADVRRRVKPGEVFCYWPQAKIAAELGCSERQVQRGVRSLREAGALDVRQRVRPCEASYVLLPPVGSGVGSGVGSHTEPRTEPSTEEVQQRTVGKPTEIPHKRADTGQTKQQRLVAAICDKLGFAVNFAGLEDFACLDNPEKQTLIKRLLKAEAWHDRRVSGDRSVTGETKRGNRSVTASRKGRLLREYAARLRAARADAGAERAISKANPPIPPADRSPGRKGNTVLPEHDIPQDTIRTIRAAHSKSWAPKRAWRFQRVDGSWE